MKRHCKATSRSTKGPCRLAPVRGAAVCHKHGGAAPQVKAKAQERAAEEQAQRALSKIADSLGPPGPVENPLLELSKIAGLALQWKNICAEQVNKLEQIRYRNEFGGEQVRAEILLFERALDRCATVLASIVRLNIDERLARIDEQQAGLIVNAVTAVLEELGLGEKKILTAKALLAVEFRRLEAVG